MLACLTQRRPDCVSARRKRPSAARGPGMPPPPVGRLEAMDAYRAVVTKRDTREFEPEPVSDSDLRRVLQAAPMAGSDKNEQVNRLLVVTDEAQRDRLARCGKFASWIRGAPVVIVFVVPAAGDRNPQQVPGVNGARNVTPFRRRKGDASMSCQAIDGIPSSRRNSWPGRE